MNIVNSIAYLIGKTLLIKINQMNSKGFGNIYGKLEIFNPLSSIKNRIALNMIEIAKKDDRLKKGWNNSRTN